MVLQCQLAVVVDDHDMGVTHVMRGEEWINSVPKHLLLYQYFGWEAPVLCHLPLLRNPDKSKLSKRKHPTSVNYYRTIGVLPEALTNYLGMMGWSMPDEREIFTPKEIADDFELEWIHLGGPVFDMEKLSWLTGHWVTADGAAEESWLEPRGGTMTGQGVGRGPRLEQVPRLRDTGEEAGGRGQIEGLQVGAGLEVPGPGQGVSQPPPLRHVLQPLRLRAGSGQIPAQQLDEEHPGDQAGEHHALRGARSLDAVLQRLDRLVGTARHLHEAEAARPSAIPVGDESDRLDGSVLTEHRADLLVGGAERQISYVDLFRHDSLLLPRLSGEGGYRPLASVTRAYGDYRGTSDTRRRGRGEEGSVASGGKSSFGVRWPNPRIRR